jgi:hypothetical protein
VAKEVLTKCNECGENFRNVRDLKQQVKKHILVEYIKREKCERMLDKEWKIKAHLRTHKLHTFENCEKKLSRMKIF